MPGETQDVALMFVPSESIYADLVEHFEDVVQRAHRARVVIVSPSLMMMAIQVTQSMLRDAAMRDSVHTIQGEVGKLMADARRLAERAAKLESHFRAAQDDLGEVHGLGREGDAAGAAHRRDGFRRRGAARRRALDPADAASCTSWRLRSSRVLKREAPKLSGRARMNVPLVITFVGPDRAGLVNAVSDAVAAHGGAWLESRLARLAGQFAGIVRADAPAEQAEAMEAALRALARPQRHGDARRAGRGAASNGCGSISWASTGPASCATRRGRWRRSASISRSSRPHLRPAPFSGELMFRAHAVLEAPEDVVARPGAATRSKDWPAS